MKIKGRAFTREDLESFLATAPDQLKDWAQQQLAQFDEASEESPEDENEDGADLAGRIEESGVPRVLYSSCNPASLAADSSRALRSVSTLSWYLTSSS